MAAYLEALILYILLFFSGIRGAVITTQQSGSFSIYSEIIRISLFFIPSIALIWYLITRKWKLEYWIIRFGKKDLIGFIITLPLLLITGISVSLIASLTNAENLITLPSPSGTAGWIILCISCLFAAYMEESFFRFYLISKREDLNLNAPAALALSSALFALCHIYEGPWGFLNAVFAGLILGFMFLRFNSFHGIAIAHGTYNIIAFILSSL
ncbi:MAG: CPBP family intramembrane metalloprotease [Treponema sp.]|nr:CPBP family intramembrane metalloprotease [Treponema sp.]MCL2251331.1 CPBP family intramembrane metalloprotease [Treponema sp.]